MSSLARTHGARSLEGYPMRPTEAKRIPAAFARTGVVPLSKEPGSGASFRINISRCSDWSFDRAVGHSLRPHGITEPMRIRMIQL